MTRTNRIALLALVSLLAACGSRTHRAPVEERAAKPSTPGASSAAPAPSAAASGPALDQPLVKLPPGAENAGKIGFYTVKPGDTLIRVGLENGQNWRDIARWNNIENPNVIEVGQVLRVLPPTADANGVITRPVSPGGKVDARALGPAGSASAPVAAASGVPAAVPAAPVPAPATAAREPDEDLGWMWPASGSVTAGFDESKTKGLQIAGKAGDPVFAAADGRVVYAGSGLRGYGNLIIVKHNNTFLSAYAHNQTLLVKEDQVVRKGQKIAEMGSSDADRVQLHFEIRRQGKPVDPARLLPSR
jgi:lipoprotein NlpD